ncbi:MAG: CopD family protein [Chloroflexota bacterium]
METPVWALTILYWFHMLATVIWLGGLAALVLLVIPAAQHGLDARAFAVLLQAIQRRLDPLGWLCLAVLTVTGMFQMSANPGYAGFLAFDSRWALAILLKHLVFGGMVVVSAYLTWGVLPGLARTALRISQGLDTPQAARLQRQNAWLLRINLFFAVVVLALTALARVS